ncbi:MAG: hypothetical protein QM786_06765 [Breznakibacter sp.]
MDLQYPTIELSRNTSGYLYYTNYLNENNSSYPLATHEIELVEVRPNIAFKSGDGYDYILKTGGLDGEMTRLITSKDSIELLPVFLTPSEYNLGTKAGEISNLFRRNTYCNYLIDTIKVNNETILEKGSTPLKTDWTKYAIRPEGLTFEVVSEKSGYKATIQSSASPFVTVIRNNKNKDMGYYIEDHYTTATKELSQNVIGYDGMKTITLGNQSRFDYKVPIVHFRNKSEVRLTLVSTDREKRKDHDKEERCYYIDGKKVKIGDTFTISPKYGAVVDITDENGLKKGAIEFKQHSGEVLRPVLNLLYLGDDLPGGMTLGKVVNTLNGYYEPMGIQWQPGREERVVPEGYYVEGKGFDDEEILRTMSSPKNEDEYYMIVVAPEDNDKGDFANGVGGFATQIGSNVLFHRYEYSGKPEILHIVPHELAHCNGLDEFAYDFGLTTTTDYERKKLNGFDGQKNNSNVMGYYGIGNYPPKLDFFLSQIAVIRQSVKSRISSNNR